jgi:hypothetical protein
VAEGEPVSLWRLNHVSDPGSLSDNPLGILPYIRQHGWEKSYAESPWGDRSWASVDESIKVHPRFVQSWATGLFPKGQTPKVGQYPRSLVADWAIECWPRGPGAFAQFDEVFKATGGMAEFIDATRARTDACRRMGGESAIYLGCPPLSAFTPTTAWQTRRATMKRWTAPIKACGFDRVEMDAAFATRQVNDAGAEYKNPAMFWAEELLAEGIAVDGEAAERVHPELFPWFNGRFGCITSWQDRDKRMGAGWFNEHCVGCVTRRFVWLLGSITPAERMANAEAELARPANERHDVVMDFAGVAPEWWKAAGGT